MKYKTLNFCFFTKVIHLVLANNFKYNIFALSFKVHFRSAVITANSYNWSFNCMGSNRSSVMT